MNGNIERLLGEIESSSDPATRERVRALVSAVLELHAGALARVGEVAGPEVIRRLAADPQVSGVLLLHGLHPDSIETRARAALDGAREILASQRATAELAAVEGGWVRVLVTRPGGCGGSAILAQVEELLVAAVPDAAAIAVEDAGALIPLSRLAIGRGGW